MKQYEVVHMADGTDIPKPAVDALDEFELVWPGASFPNARAALAARVQKALEGLGWEQLHHDDETMLKVYQVLRENGYLPDDIPGVISAFQNAGILFRERA